MQCPSPRLLLVATTLFLARCYNVSALNVFIPASAPSDAQPLAQTLFSLSIEQDRWPDWTGVQARNSFTYNALMNYATLTGRPPNIRVGADSADHTIWSPTEAMNEDIFPTPNSIGPYPEATRIVVGDAFYQLSKYLPHGTHMVWGVNLGANNATNAVNMAEAIARSFRAPAVTASKIVLDRIEVGNEPDLYTHNGLRPRNWTINDYVREWTTNAGQVVDALGISGAQGDLKLQGAAFANQGFTPSKVYDLGILDSDAGRVISVLSQHHYSAHYCKGGVFSLTPFMNKAAIRANLSLFDADIAATHAHGLEYILGETNSIACHGAPGVSNTAGSALWAIDYTLQAATRGIRETYFHEGVGYKYNLIQPVPLNRSIIDNSVLSPPSPPAILPSYYAGLVVNTFLGNTGSSKIIELTINDTNVSGYAAFEQGRLARAVFVNLNAWLKNSTGDRPIVPLVLNITGSPAGSPNRTVLARRLVIQRADDVANLTWAGRSFETKDALPQGTVVAEHIALNQNLQLHSSEALLIDFLSQSGPVPTSTPRGRRGLAETCIGVVVACAIVVAGGWWYRRRRKARTQNMSQYAP